MFEDLTIGESDRLQAISDDIERKRAAGQYTYQDFRAALREVLFISKGRGLAEFLYDSVPDPKWLSKADREASQWDRQARRAGGR